MKTRYYLNSVKLIHSEENCSIFYECIYSNGILEHLELLPVNLNESINIPTIYEN